MKIKAIRRDRKKSRIRISTINVSNKNMLIIGIKTFGNIYFIFNKPKTPKQRYFKMKYDFLHWKKKTRKALKFWWKYRVQKSEVYYYYSSTDCDLCTSERYGKCDTIEEYYKAEENIYESAEGSTCIYIVSKEEYEENGNEVHTTDHILRAYENGNGSRVII